ncbi:MAG: hypothetical protein KGI91_07000 [Burkholderiales bacterium]|nr:hypothetical protein [Burkholderiales bacterium]MDE2076804.1 hypothetical protein [Burkholderiales bacterium]MDE2431992.1 hypothetical protein [Burkholderiales bacterium]
MKRWNGLWASMAVVAACAASAPALAHDDAYLDTLTAPHGGQLRMAGPQHLELVLVKDSAQAKDNPVMVYVTDHAGTPASTQGATGTVTLLMGKTKVSAPLQPDGDNRLKATAHYASLPGIKAVVSIKLAGQDVQQARFTPLAPKPAASMPMDHAH